jgi:protein MBA1
MPRAWLALEADDTHNLCRRSVYKRCIYHKGWARFLPIDNFAHKPIETTAKTLYQEVYASFAQSVHTLPSLSPNTNTTHPTYRANMSPVSKFCLPPILENFETRIKARGPIEIDWKVLGGMKAKVVSHRASMFGEDQPDTAFRQVVVRITSRQRLENKFANNPVATGERKVAKGRAPGWVPLDVKKPETKPEAKAKSKPKTKAVTKNTETTKEVVEYFVLQKRVNRGVEDKQWKVWGFTQESTPERLEEDSEYWRKILSSTAGASG